VQHHTLQNINKEKRLVLRGQTLKVQQRRRAREVGEKKEQGFVYILRVH